ncbi:ABC transporter permease [Bacillus salitolerans]|uniref:ABC transporter permease n=1 Tax=Bacillus salitolerans TaxID=1437434 RepID=A0ABW4LY23_9BACI
MRKYWQLTKSQMQTNTAYSAWYWAGSISTIMRLLIMYFFWHAVYESRSTIENIDLSTMLTYIVIAMLLQGYVGGIGNELAENIRNGDVAIELMRPYDLIFKLISLDLGSKFTYFFRETIPMVVIAFLFMKLMFPTSIEVILLFLVSAFLGIWIGTFFDFIIGVLAFWTVNIWGLRVLKEGVFMFFSGALVPIVLFPEWLKSISLVLPFQSMIYVPVSIYTGILTGIDAYMAVGIQLIWVVALYILVRAIWAQALKQITIFGG